MLTPIFVCGGECGIMAEGFSWNFANEHWTNVSAVAGAFSVVTSGPAPMRSPRAIRVNSNGNTTARAFFASSISSPAVGVARFYICFGTLPTSSNFFFGFDTGSGNRRGLYYTSSDHSLRVGGPNSGFQASSGKIITTGVWYRIDLKVSITGTSPSVEWKVDGVDQTPFTTPQGASSIPTFTMGIGDTQATPIDVYFDDICISGTAADYPIGEGSVVGLYPNADGVHGGGWASGTFGKGAGGLIPAANTDTDIWQSLAKPLSVTPGTSWVANLLGVVVSNYVEFAFDDMPWDVASINGATIVAALRGKDGTSGNQSLRLADSSAGAPVSLVSATVNFDTITNPIFVRNIDRAGVLWTSTLINDVRFRWASTDSDPDMYLDGVCFEVDYVHTPPQSVPLPSAILTLTPGTLSVTLISANGSIMVWTGSAWVAKPMKIWNGSAWVQKPVKRWTGTAWVIDA